MAFVTLTAGDRLLLADGMNVRPKIPKSGYTPQVGDIVTEDTATEDGVDLIAVDEQFYGMVMSLNSWDSSNTTRPISVYVFQSGAVVILPYTGTVNKGDHVEFSSNTRDVAVARTKVKQDNTNGDLRSRVVAIDTGTQYGTGFLALEFL